MNIVNLYWVPGPIGVPVNEKADEYAWKISEIRFGEAVQTKQRHLRFLLSRVEEMATAASGLICTHEFSLTTAQWMRRGSLLKLSKLNIRLLTGITTGHGLIVEMAARLRNLHNDFCRSCRAEEEIESIQHFLCECPTHRKKHFKFLRGTFFESFTENSIWVVYSLGNQVD